MTQIFFPVNAVEYLFELSEKLERGLTHHLQYIILGVFGRHFEAAGYMAGD